MALIILALALVVLIGHAALWVGLANRIHSTGLSRPMVKVFSGPCLTALVAIPLAAALLWWRSGLPLLAWLEETGRQPIVAVYVALCCGIAAVTTVLLLARHTFANRNSPIIENRTRIVDVAGELGRKPIAGLRAQLFSYVPGNQILELAVQEIDVLLPRLPYQLDGFSITLLSDLHFTGRIGIEYYRAVVREANGLGADLIAVCGDVLDDVEYLRWIPETLGQLKARDGVYFILGNHDSFTGQAPAVRSAISKAGLINLAGQVRQLAIDGAELILAGNELPWMKPAPDMQACPPRSADRPQLRVLLSHSPDQICWAQRWDFDLMLAGHSHGGQFRLPIIGPIFCPCWHGVKYAAGSFYCPPMVMHVSRGVAAEIPLRLNCRPEVTKLVLRSVRLPGA
jgi:predicted MPP superfamily phosphohydrolase